MATKSKITFVVPENLQKDLRVRVINDGYGMRGKSIWVSEAIKSLTEISSYPELVNYSDEMHTLEKVETVVIDQSIRILLDDAIVRTRTVFPTMEGVKSRIVRTAILQRLLRTSP